MITTYSKRLKPLAKLYIYIRYLATNKHPIIKLKLLLAADHETS